MEKVKEVVQKIIQFIKEAKVELKKVTWPTPKQTLASTAVVIIIVFIVSIYLGIVDFVLAKLVKFVLG
jgi:preprotein translocase subunit SecE